MNPDPDLMNPDPDSMNPDPKHWLKLNIASALLYFACNVALLSSVSCVSVRVLDPHPFHSDLDPGF